MNIDSALKGSTIYCLVIFLSTYAQLVHSQGAIPEVLKLLLLDEPSDPLCTVPNSYFSGSYLMEQLTGTDPFYASETFGDTQIVNIVANGNKRSFQFIYYPEVPSLNRIYNFEMTLDCGEIHVEGSITANVLGCEDGENIGFSTGIPIAGYSSFSVTDDDIMLVNVTDYDPNGGCVTVDSYQIELRFTEQ